MLNIFKSKEQRKLEQFKMKIELIKLKNERYKAKTERMSSEMKHFVKSAKETEKLGDLFQSENEWIQFSNSPIGQQLATALIGFAEKKTGVAPENPSQEIKYKSKIVDVDALIRKATSSQRTAMSKIIAEIKNG